MAIRSTRFRRWTLFALFPLFPFGGCETPPWDTSTEAQRQAVVAKVNEIFGEEYTVQKGEIVWYSVENFDLPFYGGPAPGGYLLPSFDPLPGEHPGADHPSQVDEIMETVDILWRLPEKGAVVFVLRTPDLHRYLGFQIYTWWRWNPVLKIHQLQSTSLGDSINQLVLKTSGTPNGQPGNPWNQLTMIIATPDKNTYTKLRDQFEAEGFSSAWINPMPVPKDFRPGLGREGDTLSMVVRMAIPSDEEKDRQYKENPPGVVLRMIPKVDDTPVDRYPDPEFRQRGTGRAEQWLQPAFLRLVEAITTYHREEGYEVDVIPLPQFEGPFSLPRAEEPFMPMAGSTDSLGGFTPPVSFDEPNTFYVVVGPNHRNTWKASYTSLTLYDLPQQKPAITVNDKDDFPGAVPWYLNQTNPNDQEQNAIAAHFLYAFRFARPDGLQEAYVPVPTTAIPQNVLGAFVERDYLERATQTGPSKSECLSSVLLRIRKPAELLRRGPRVVRR